MLSGALGFGVYQHLEGHKFSSPAVEDMGPTRHSITNICKVFPVGLLFCFHERQQREAAIKVEQEVMLYPFTTRPFLSFKNIVFLDL